MISTNHSSKRPAYSRVYWITNPGQKLIAYLDFTAPTPVVPPEHFDDDRAQPPDDPEEQSLEDAGYDGMGGKPWDAGFEDPAIDDEIEED